MPKPSLRSRSLRRVKVKRPGGKHVIHYKKRKPSHAKCGNCGTKLSGIPRERPSQLTKLSKTEKKPTRPYGGNLCPSCTKETIKSKFLIKWD